MDVGRIRTAVPADFVASLIILSLVFVLLFFTKPPDGPIIISNLGRIERIEMATERDGTLSFSRDVPVVVFKDDFGVSFSFQAPKKDFGDSFEGMRCRIHFREIWQTGWFPWWDVNVKKRREWQLLAVERVPIP